MEGHTDKTPKEDLARSTQLLHQSIQHNKYNMTKTTTHHYTRVKCSNCNITTDNFGRTWTDKTPKEHLAKFTQLLHQSIQPIVYREKNSINIGI